MKSIATTYTFNQSAKTITCDLFASYGLNRILMIVNVTRGIVYYNPSNTATTGTLSGNVLTLATSTTGHNNNDVLQIFVDDGNTGSTEESLSQLVMALTELAERLDIYSDGNGRLQIALTNTAAQGALSSVGIVTTLSTLTSATNLVNAGAGSTNLDNLWRYLMQTPSELQNSLFPVT